MATINHISLVLVPLICFTILGCGGSDKKDLLDDKPIKEPVFSSFGETVRNIDCNDKSISSCWKTYTGEDSVDREAVVKIDRIINFFKKAIEEKELDLETAVLGCKIEIKTHALMPITRPTYIARRRLKETLARYKELGNICKERLSL